MYGFQQLKRSGTVWGGLAALCAIAVAGCGGGSGGPSNSSGSTSTLTAAREVSPAGPTGFTPTGTTAFGARLAGGSGSSPGAPHQAVGALEFAVTQTQGGIIGVDNRQRVATTTSYPWRAVCQLISVFPRGTTYGSGFFIGPRTIATAGQCVYNSSLGGWATRVDAIPGGNGSSRPYGTVSSTNLRSANGWVSSHDTNWDIGAVILSSDTVGNQVGWFGFSNLPNNQTLGEIVNTAGYPSDKPSGTQWWDYKTVVNVGTGAASNTLTCNVDAVAGQGGSPLYFVLNNERIAIGLFAFDPGGPVNGGVRITAPIYELLYQWRNNP